MDELFCPVCGEPKGLHDWGSLDAVDNYLGCDDCYDPDHDTVETRIHLPDYLFEMEGVIAYG